MTFQEHTVMWWLWDRIVDSSLKTQMPSPLRYLLIPWARSFLPSNSPAPSFLWMSDALGKMSESKRSSNPPPTICLYISIPDPKYKFLLSKAPQKDHRIPTLSILPSLFACSTILQATFSKPRSPCWVATSKCWWSVWPPSWLRAQNLLNQRLCDGSTNN